MNYQEAGLGARAAVPPTSEVSWSRAPISFVNAFALAQKNPLAEQLGFTRVKVLLIESGIRDPEDNYSMRIDVRRALQLEGRGGYGKIRTTDAFGHELRAAHLTIEGEPDPEMALLRTVVAAHVFAQEQIAELDFENPARSQVFDTSLAQGLEAVLAYQAAERTESIERVPGSAVDRFLTLQETDASAFQCLDAIRAV